MLIFPHSFGGYPFDLALAFCKIWPRYLKFPVMKEIITIIKSKSSLIISKFQDKQIMFVYFSMKLFINELSMIIILFKKLLVVHEENHNRVGGVISDEISC